MAAKPTKTLLTAITVGIAALSLSASAWVIKNPTKPPSGAAKSQKAETATLEPDGKKLKLAVSPAQGSKTVKNLLAILWDPRDTDGRVVPDAKKIDSLLFGLGKSVKGYYAQESGGLAEIRRAGVMGWYPAKKPAAHYWAAPDATDADGDGYINGHNEKWAEAIMDAAAAGFDFAKYDVNGDGTLDPETELAVLIVIPSSSPFGTNRTVLSREYPEPQPMIVNGVKIGQIAEWYTDPSLNFGAPAHEIGHLLFGFPDLYQDSPYRASSYSLFDGSYCDCEIDPWEKAVQGWLDIAAPSQSGQYSLRSMDSSHEAIRISRQGSDEFFLIENRERGVYDAAGDPGLLVWDIIKPFTAGDWGRDNIRLIRRNGGNPINDGDASYHMRDGRPGATGELKWADGSLSGISLSDISAAGPEMSFTLTMK